jgi:hypothetical protein
VIRSLAELKAGKADPAASAFRIPAVLFRHHFLVTLSLAPDF